jgi:hypothetical protein
MKGRWLKGSPSRKDPKTGEAPLQEKASLKESRDMANDMALPAPVCPQCAGFLTKLGTTFRAPKQRDIDGWQAVELLHEAGFRFNPGTGPLPTTAKEAREFIEINRPRSEGEKLARRIQRPS